MVYKSTLASRTLRFCAEGFHGRDSTEITPILVRVGFKTSLRSTLARATCERPARAGPKTRAGRRRSALNRLAFKPKEIKLIWGGMEPKGHREFLRIWRDLRFLFWFVKRDYWWQGPRLEMYLRSAALAWQSKLHAMRNGFSADTFDAQIESSLADFMFEYRLCNRKCDCWCRKEFGAGSREVRKLREGIEVQMSSFHERQLKQAPVAATSRRRAATRSDTATPAREGQPGGGPTVTSLDRNQWPITFEDLGLGPYQPPFGPEFPGNRNQEP